MTSVLGEIDLTAQEGNLKDIFGPKVLEQVPDETPLQKEIGFSQRDRIGQHYVVPVKLTNSHGVTYASSDSGAFALNSPIAGVFKEALVDASQMLFREFISYESASRARGSSTSFLNMATEAITYGLKSARYRIESTMIHGGTSIFTLLSDDTGSGTTRTFTIEDATFTPGVVAGLQGAEVDGYDDGDASNKQNTNAVLTVDAVDIGSKKVTLTGNSTDMSTINTQLGTAPVHIFFQGSAGNEPIGLRKICGATGTTFNIDGSSYNLWTGNTHTVSSSSQLTLDELQQALVLPGNKGAMGGTWKCCLSHETFKDLNNNASAFRLLDSSYSKDITQGHTGLKYAGSVGMIDVKVHPMSPEGIALVYKPEVFKRIGSTDLAFGVPGSTNKFLSELENNAGYQFRLYSDQALFCESLKSNVLVTGFTNG